jgi:hypothetical protein
MKNTGRIIRSNKNGGSRYTPILNEILQSKTLQPEEKSILVHLLSLPQDWVIYKTFIWKDMNIGRDRFNKHWNGLVEKGYIHSIRITKDNGQFSGYDYEVLEEPFIELNRLTEIQLTGIQLPEIQSVNKVIKEKVINKKDQDQNKLAQQDNLSIKEKAKALEIERRKVINDKLKAKEQSSNKLKELYEKGKIKEESLGD